MKGLLTHRRTRLFSDLVTYTCVNDQGLKALKFGRFGELCYCCQTSYANIMKLWMNSCTKLSVTKLINLQISQTSVPLVFHCLQDVRTVDTSPNLVT